MVFTALAVDTGRLWVEHRQLQAIADIAALEAARALECRADRNGGAAAAAQAAAVRNGYESNLATAPNRVEVGILSTDKEGLRHFTATGPSPVDAVRVLATESVPASLVLGGLFGQTTLISVEATAQAEPFQVAFSAGSFLLRIDTTSQDASLLNALLGGLLGSSLSLDAVSYKGLADTNVNLAQLVQASATVGSVEELLNANLTVDEVIDLTATAVGQNSAASVALNGLHAAAGSASIRLGDVLNVAVPSSDAAATATINVFDLVNATLMLANKNHAVELGLSIPGIAAVQLAIIEAPQLAVGPPGLAPNGNWCTEAKTAQLRLEVDVNPAGLGLVDLALNLELARANAHLTDARAVAGAASIEIGAEPGIAALSITNTAHTGPASIAGLLKVGLDLPLSDPQAAPLDFSVTTPIADHLPMRKTTSASLGSSLQNALSDPDAIKIEVAGLDLLGALLLKPLVAPILAPLLGTIGGAILDPLLKILGIQLGGVDITVEDIQNGRGARLVI